MGKVVSITTVVIEEDWWRSGRSTTDEKVESVNILHAVSEVAVDEHC